MQRLEVVRGHSEFLNHFSIPQANPARPYSALIRHSLLITGSDLYGRVAPVSSDLYSHGRVQSDSEWLTKAAVQFLFS